MNGLVLVHDEVPGRGAAEVGTIAPALAELGFEVVVATFLPGGPPVPDPEQIAVLVVLGSSAAADDDSLPWLGPEWAYLVRSIELGVPVLGICFGAQLLARALHGTVGRAARPERGFVPLLSADRRVLPDGEWLQFHDDTFTLPPGAELVAANEIGVQAFRHGRHVGVQFHPEITPAVFATWVGSWRATGELGQVRTEIDLPALTAEVAARATASAAACRDLVNRWVHLGSRGPATAAGDVSTGDRRARSGSARHASTAPASRTPSAGGSPRFVG